MLAGRLRERDQYLEGAAARIAAARDGQGSTVLLVGEGGLGKTALLDEISAGAGADLRLARAQCDAMEAALPFGLLLQIVHALGGADDHVWSAASGQGAGDTRSATLYRSLQWLQKTATSPVLITIDDLQWADPDSLAGLGFLCRRLAALPVVIVASLRSWPAAASVDFAHGLVSRGDATLERLAPLSEHAAAAVLAERHGALPAGLDRRLWQLSGGNPQLLLMAASALLADGTSRRPSTEHDGRMDERSLVLRRFAGLNSDGIRWAQAAAVLGSSFRPDLVSEVAGMDPQHGEVAARGLWGTGLVRSAADKATEFVHPIFAQLLYDDLPPLVRLRLHSRAFSVLRERSEFDAAAEHAVRGDLVGDPAAVEVLCRTGRRAYRAGASQTAVSRLEAAVRLSGEAPAPALMALLAQALLEVGRLGDAVTTTTRLLQGDLDARTRVEALTVLSRAHFTMGDLDRAGSALRTATALAQHACPDAVVVPLCQYAAGVLMAAGPAAALPLAQRAEQLAASADPQVRDRACAVRAMLAYWCGDPSGLPSLFAAGRQLQTGTDADIAQDLRSLPAAVLSPFAGTAALAGLLDEAEAAFRTGIEAAERIGAVNAGAALRIGFGVMLLSSRLQESLVIAEELLAVADLVPFAEPFARTIKSHVLLEMGEQAASLAEHDRAQAAASGYGLWLCLLRLQYVQGLRLLRSGRSVEAAEVFARMQERELELGIGEPCLIPYGRHAVVAHVQAGRVVQAEHLLTRLDDQAARLPCRWPQAAVAASRAVLALHHGRHIQADALYRSAAELLKRASLPLDLAEVLLDHGTMLCRAGRPAEGRELLRRAAELAESVGGLWLAGRASDELRAAGGRRSAPRAADELTPQEQRIAQLARTGASNKDIATHLSVSVRTVRTHLESVYRKLGIHSRRELMLRR